MDTKNICGTRIVTGGATASSVGQVLNFPLLLGTDLQSSVDEARLDVQHSDILVERALPMNNSFPHELLILQKLDGVSWAAPYNSVNVVEKSKDTVYKINDCLRNCDKKESCNIQDSSGISTRSALQCPY